MANPSLDNLLNQQLTRLGQLLTLLEQETDALLKRDVEQIETLIKQKISMLDEIKIADIGIGRHPEVESIKQTPALVELMDKCQQSLEQCQLRNTHNAEQAEQVSASISRLQQVLLGASHQNTMTYTGKGNTDVGQRIGKVIKA